LFPEDQQIELEYWAETGDFSPSELHLMKIQEHRLFSISPRSGKLQPGQQKTVQFTYRSGNKSTVMILHWSVVLWCTENYKAYASLTDTNLWGQIVFLSCWKFHVEERYWWDKWFFSLQHA